MDETMPKVNEEMRATADFAIKSAKQRYGLDLDYSEDSLEVLDSILQKIYWEFSGQTPQEKESGLVYNTAIIWGAFLGEYMCLKWGGTWTFNGSYRCVSITGIEVSPVSFAYQKITNHPEYSVENYVNETKNLIYASVIHPTKSHYLPDDIGQPKKQTPSRKFIKAIKFDKRLLYGLAGFLGMLLIVVACQTGYRVMRSGSLGGLGIIANLSRTHTPTPQPTLTVTATPAYSKTPSPTVTQLPTYTPKPTNTPRPSPTPSMTYTQLPSLTPTATPTKTRIPYEPPTATTEYSPPKPPPPPIEPPVTIESCQVNPSTVPPGSNVTLTFAVQFSAPGYNFSVSDFNPAISGQAGCSGSDNDGDRIASCDGSSGTLNINTEVKVTLSSSVGECVVSYSSR